MHLSIVSTTDTDKMCFLLIYLIYFIVMQDSRNGLFFLFNGNANDIMQYLVSGGYQKI